MLPVSEIRDQFPIYKNKKDLIYLDSASTTQKPQKVTFENPVIDKHTGT